MTAAACRRLPIAWLYAATAAIRLAGCWRAGHRIAGPHASAAPVAARHWTASTTPGWARSAWMGVGPVATADINGCPYTSTDHLRPPGCRARCLRSARNAGAAARSASRYAHCALGTRPIRISAYPCAWSSRPDPRRSAMGVQHSASAGPSGLRQRVTARKPWRASFNVLPPAGVDEACPQSCGRAEGDNAPDRQRPHRCVATDRWSVRVTTTHPA